LLLDQVFLLTGLVLLLFFVFVFAYCVFSTKMAFIRFASCQRVLESSLFCTLY